jgi:hypothetical protein
MENKTYRIDSMSHAEVFSELLSFFGTQRTIELLGWVFVACFYQFENANDLRHQLEAKGMRKSAFYNALSDIRRFAEHIEQVPAVRGDTSLSIHYVRQMPKIHMLDIP